MYRLNGWLLCICLAISTPLHAAKVGFGLAGSSGTGEATDGTYEYDEETGEIDFVLNVGDPKSVFNWRLNLGFVAGETERTRPAPAFRTEFDGFIVNNTFGLKVFHSEAVRFWIGPTINLGAFEVTTTTGTFVSDVFAFGFGPTVGVDFDLPKRAPTIGAELNLRFINLSYDDSSLQDDDIVDLLARLTVMWGS